MAISISFNGVVYSIPETGDESWGESLTSYFVAIPQGALQKTGGVFTLTADVNFGANYGLLSKYFSTRTALPSTAGLVRLAVTDTIGWKNNAGDGNLLLAINGSNQLTFNGTAIYPAGITALTGDVTATGPGSVAATVAFVGGYSAANVAAGATLANAAVSANTASAIVKRDASGNFIAGTITAALTGTASGNTTYTANQYGVVVSGSDNVMGVIAPDASTTKVLVSGGASANPSWQTLGSGALALGAFGSTPNSSGASLSGATLTLQPADGTNPGGVSILAQTLAGVKTFSSAPVMSALTASQVVVTDSGKALASLAYASANTVSAIVQRDGSGNFSAGTITASLTGTASGNTTISANQYGVVLSGAANVLQVLAPDSSATKVLKSGGASANPSWLAYDNANTVSTLVFRDSSGNFSAGTITATLSGTATNATNVATTSVSTNATYYPLFVASSSNGNQAASLGTGLTFNPSTNILSTTGLNLSTLTASQAVVTDSSKNLASLAYTTTATASALAQRDSSANLSANSHLDGYTTTATAAATTTLTVASTKLQFFTGSTTQTVALPVTSTLVLGQQFQIINNSSGVVTVNSSGGNAVQVMAASSIATITCILTSGTSAASWNTTYSTAAAGGGSVTSVALSVPGSSIFGVSGSPVTSSGTLALTTTGTSGGIPYFSSSSVLTSSAALAQYCVVLGGGAGATPATLATDAATTKFLRSGGSSANPSWSALTNADLPTIRSQIWLNTSNGHGSSTGTRIARWTNVNTNTGSDMTLTQSSTAGDSITINTAGLYAMSVCYCQAASGNAFGVSVNASSLTTDINALTQTQVLCFSSMAVANQVSCTSTCVVLAVNDVIRMQTDNSTDGANNTHASWIVTKIGN